MNPIKPLCLAVAVLAHVATVSAAPTGQELYHALLVQDAPKVKQLLAAGADANHKENGRPMLVWAAQSMNAALVQTLLDGKADVNKPDEAIGHTPLMRAVETQSLEITKVLLAAKADANAKAANGESVLGMAIRSGKAELVEALLKGGADPKVLTKDGESPTLLAVMENLDTSVPIIKLLGKAGADLNAANILHTPLTYATEQGNVEIVAALLEVGANPNIKGPGGKAPLEYADKPEIVASLLAAKADPNLESDSGTTPLIRAIQYGELGTVEALLKAGAKVDRADSSGSLPIQVANNYGKSDVVELLKRYGAKEE